MSALLALCEGNPLEMGWFPSQSASNVDSVLCHVVIILEKFNFVVIRHNYVACK